MGKISSSVALVLLVVVALLLIAANNLVFKGARFDLTQDRMFSISDGTVATLESLESDVNIKFFYSEEDSSELGFLRDYARRITDLLDEYKLRSDGRVTLEVIDPAPFSEQEDQASELGIDRISLGFGEEPIYFGLVAIGESGNTESIEFLHPDREEFLEYDITRLVHGVSRTREPLIGMISALPLGGGFDQVQRRPSPPWQTYTQLRQLYQVTDLGPGAEEIGSEIDLLLVVHPENMTAQTLYAIDQYVLGGGSVLVFVDELAQTDPLLQATAALPDKESAFAPLLAAWGVTLVNDRVLADAEHALRVGGGATQQPTPHLGVFGYGAPNFAESDHPVLRNLNNINFSSSGILQPIENSSTSFSPLIQSSIRSGLLDVALLQNLTNPSQLMQNFTPTGERYAVAAHITGSANTAYPDGRPEIPPLESDATGGEQLSGDTDGGSQSGASDQSLDEVISDINAGIDTGSQPKEDSTVDLNDVSVHIDSATGDGINVLVVADTDLLNDAMWVRVSNFFGQPVAQPFADNGNFFINLVESLMGSSELMSLRSRGQFGRPFHVVEALEREAAERFQDKEQQLQQRLQQTEARLAELQQSREGEDRQTLNDEQQQELDDFRSEHLAIRKELRGVRHQLNQNIERLGGWVKLINIIGMPLIVTGVALFFAGRRKRTVRRANAAT